MLAVVVPFPPLLAPALAGLGQAAAAAAEPMRRAVREAVPGLLADLQAVGDPESPWTVMCVGPGTVTRRHPIGSWGTLAGFGSGAAVGGAAPRPRPRLLLHEAPSGVGYLVARWSPA